MYRQYENPYDLEEKLKEAQEAYDRAVDAGRDVEELIYLAEDIAELKQRINQAWQDDEYDMEQEDREFDY